MHVVVPFSADRPKTRLADELSAAERRDFSEAMLSDVLDALDGVDRALDVTVLATGPVDTAGDATVEIDDRPLTTAVNDRLDTAPTAVVMADLALATPEPLADLLDSEADLAIAAGLGGGTNAFLARDTAFRVDYHGASYRDHLEIAGEEDLSVREVDSRLLAVDIDEPADLAELLLHGEGAATDWLVDAGFELDVGGGRVEVVRY
ncbi:2-phospho-L-lactate guanylyltransferase [Halolamina salifodinae]|uniref:2-phospho-L-lactate guanylyltransferase n=1 Tax=Halolamina salifodinae TaxID=1202767 RepID=A0A8T4GXW7_9EURY|nr:2-phospho-L-lactate guanylyltransferase [Halolamina salifodinae]MBP1987829.1 2-phospho-L-lactate guanylyltransferase [Halolamina salifodinae]